MAILLLLIGGLVGGLAGGLAAPVFSERDIKHAIYGTTDPPTNTAVSAVLLNYSTSAAGNSPTFPSLSTDNADAVNRMIVGPAVATDSIGGDFAWEFAGKPIPTGFTEKGEPFTANQTG